ncbi:MAG: pirin family protein [Propionibacteriaceae bacterium]
MSDLDTHPEVVACRSSSTADQTLTARKVWLGRTTEVERVLPDRTVRMIGAWCFLDHYGPQDVSDGPGMQVWAHPHTGLQTVSYLLDGEIEHRDSVGSHAMVRPGELHVMTAGRGIVHSELSLAEHPPRLHGLQLWVALPDHARSVPPSFDSYAALPPLAAPGVTGQVVIGTLAGVSAPASGHTPLCAADLRLAPATTYRLPLDPSFEYGVLVVAGSASVDDHDLAVDQLRYTEPGRTAVTVVTEPGCRLLVIGGEPFAEEIVMWWNFVGRSHEEVAAYRQEWLARADRFPAVVSRGEKVLEAPMMPNVTLRPRPRRTDLGRADLRADRDPR